MTAFKKKIYLEIEVRTESPTYINDAADAADAVHDLVVNLTQAIKDARDEVSNSIIIKNDIWTVSE